MRGPPHATHALLIAFCGFASLAVGDAIVKSMAGAWPATAVSATRFCLTAAGLGVILMIREGRRAFTVRRPLHQLGRGAALGAASVFFFLGVMAMPLASATALVLTSPMITAALATALTREKPRPSVWGAIALAFLGVLLVLRPNVEAVGLHALFPVCAAAGMACLMLLNRAVAGDASPLATQLHAAIFAAPLLVAAAAGLAILGGRAFEIALPDLIILAKVAAVALAATLGHYLIYTATLFAPAVIVAPMTYAQLLVAALLGWLFWGHAPDEVAACGMVLIVLAGMWLWRTQAASSASRRVNVSHSRSRQPPGV